MTMTRLASTMCHAPVDALSATAKQSYAHGLSGQVDTQDPLDGWVEPVATSSTVDGRNAGRFSLTFDWGTVSGTYESDDSHRLEPRPSR